MKKSTLFLVLLLLLGCDSSLTPTPDTASVEQEIGAFARLQQLPLLPTQLCSGGYEWASGEHYLQQQLKQASVPPLRLELTGLSDRSVLLSLSVLWEGAAGHLDPVQAYRPTFALYEMDDKGHYTILGYKHDAITDRDTYEVPHSIDLGLGSAGHEISLRHRYELLFWGEDGSHFIPKGHLRSVTAKLVLPSSSP
jgi:hypothetical protein